MNLIVGAKADSYPGWLSTDKRETGGPPLDIRLESDWLRYFAPGSLDRIACEHVLEHMTFDDAFSALCNFRKFLRPGGFARIAVPDGLNPDPGYQSLSRPDGFVHRLCYTFLFAPDEPAHAVIYDAPTLARLITMAGLTPRLLEYYDAAGIFHREIYDAEAAPIKRRWGTQYNADLQFWLGYPNMSLLVDAYKQGW
jgi:predicted SAM-dependent methyltransferase